MEKKTSRKKVCPKCGRKLWLKEFYKLSDGSLYTYCRECARVHKREYYRNTYKVPDRTYKSHDWRLMVHSGYSTSIYWSSYMMETLKRLYPTTKNEELAVRLGVSMRTLIRKAREIGLFKDPEWQRNNSKKHVQMAILHNKIIGNSGMIRKGQHLSPETEFKSKRT